MRDLLIGAVPPETISDWRYLGVSLLAGVIPFRRAYASASRESAGLDSVMIVGSAIPEKFAHGMVHLRREDERSSREIRFADDIVHLRGEDAQIHRTVILTFGRKRGL